MPQAAKEKENYFSAYKLFAKTREGKDPAWLENLRGRAVDSFEALDFPTTRVEEWKYTNVAPILKTPFRQMFDLGVHAAQLVVGPMLDRVEHVGADPQRIGLFFRHAPAG